MKNANVATDFKPDTVYMFRLVRNAPNPRDFMLYYPHQIYRQNPWGHCPADLPNEIFFTAYWSQCYGYDCTKVTYIRLDDRNGNIFHYYLLNGAWQYAQDASKRGAFLPETYLGVFVWFDFWLYDFAREIKEAVYAFLLCNKRQRWIPQKDVVKLIASYVWQTTRDVEMWLPVFNNKKSF